MKVYFPISSDFAELCKFSCEVDSVPEQGKLNFQTGHLRYFTPTNMLMLAKICRKRSRKFSNEKLTYSGLEKHGYANNLGFSEALNIKGRPYPQGAYGGGGYYPISSMRRARLESIAERKGIAQGDAIQLECEGIAKVVSQMRLPSLQKHLADSFREIFRNTFEHAQVSGAVFCAQYWPSKDLVEICIADRGIGVHKSLEENPHINPVDERQSLYMSLMPGVSSKAWRYRKRKASQKTDWDNSGHGLFFAHQLFGRLGTFCIASGGSALIIEKGQPVRDMPCDLAGTLVSMRLDLSSPEAIESCIEGIAKKAHRIKEKIGARGIKFESVEAFLKNKPV